MAVSNHWSGTKRPRFFSGRLVTADDLAQEQEYHLWKHRRHLQMLHGYGVVNGLQVKTAVDDVRIAIEPGLAIDREGREIHLDEEVVLTVPSESPSPTWVVIEYTERAVDPVPVSSGGVEASRTEEGCCVTLASAPCDSGVVIARLIPEQDGWHADPSFVPARPR